MILFFFDNSSGNNIKNNTSFSYILSGYSSRGSSHKVKSKGWRDNISAFTSRTLIKSNWLNQADVYFKPQHIDRDDK
jgi:hypothetical protein